MTSKTLYLLLFICIMHGKQYINVPKAVTKGDLIFRVFPQKMWIREASFYGGQVFCAINFGGSILCACRKTTQMSLPKGWFKNSDWRVGVWLHIGWSDVAQKFQGGSEILHKNSRGSQISQDIRHQEPPEPTFLKN